MNIALFLDDSFAPASEFFPKEERSAVLSDPAIRAVSLAEIPSVLERAGSGTLLVMGHAEKCPAQSAEALAAFLERGGDTLWLGGQPFGLNTLWIDGGWAPKQRLGWAELGLSPWYVEPVAGADHSEPRMAALPEYAGLFGSAAEFVVERQLCQLMPLGAGRRVVLGRMAQGASAPLRTDLFAMVEPGLPWNRNGARVICCGVKPGRGWTGARTAALIGGVARFLEKDAPDRLEAGFRLSRVSAPCGTQIGIELALRNGAALRDPCATVADAEGETVRRVPLNGSALEIPTEGLPSGRYRVAILDGAEPTGLEEWFSLVEKPSAAPPKVGVSMEGRYAAFTINGKPVPMQSYCGYANPRTIETIIPGFRDAGIHVYHIGVALGWGWPGPQRYDWSAYDYAVERVLREDPQAVLFPRVRLSEPAWWRESHPESLWRHETGLEAAVPDTTPSLFMSYFDPAWRRDTIEAMRAFIRHSRQSWYRGHVVGVFYTYGMTGEWGEECRNGIFWADHHPAFVEKFRTFLRRKYGTDEALRTAWSRAPDIRSEDLLIPRSRRFRESNDQTHLFDNPTACLEKARQIGEVSIEGAGIPNFFRRYLARHGMLRDPDHVRDVFDFLECYMEGFAELQQELSDEFKRAGDILTGTFIGYTLGGACDIDGGHQQDGFPEFMDTARSLDILTTASFYLASDNPTGDQVCRGLHESISLYGKSYLQENDQRTCLAEETGNGPQPGTSGESLRDSCGSMKRNWVIRVSRGSGLWWFDFSRGYYDHPELTRLLGRLHGIYWRLIREPNGRAFDRELGRCVMFYSARSHLFFSGASSNFMHRLGQNLPQLHFNRYGIPWEIYFPEDIARVPSRRVYLFLNTLFLTREQRQVINDRFKRDGNILIWLYGSGLFDEGGYAVSKASELTGFRLEAADEWRKLRIQLLDRDHSVINALRGADMGDFGSVVNCDPYMGADMDRVSPQLFVSEKDRDAVPLGVQEGTSRIAFAVKECDDWTSVYASAAILPARVMRAILAWKGVELHTDGLDNFYTNGDLVGLNSLSTGYKVIRFPADFDLEDLMSGETHVSRNREVRVWVPYRDTFLGRVFANERTQSCPE